MQNNSTQLTRADGQDLAATLPRNPSMASCAHAAEKDTSLWTQSRAAQGIRDVRGAIDASECGRTAPFISQRHLFATEGAPLYPCIMDD
jgi:hypothetical protein